MVLLLLWGGISIAWTLAPTMVALRLCLVWLPLPFFASLLILSATHVPQNIERQTFTLLMASFFFLAIIIFCRATAERMTNTLWNTWPWDIWTLKHAGFVLGAMTFVTFGFLWTYNKKILAMGAFFLAVGCLFLAGSSTSFCGVLIGSFIFLLSYQQPLWVTRLLMGTSYTFVILTPFLFSSLLPTLLKHHDQWLQKTANSFFHRLLIWDFLSSQITASRFLWGFGLGSNRYLATQHIRPGYDANSHPHNAGLEAYVELGLLGGVLFALLVASLFWLVTKYVKDKFSVAVCNATILYAFIQYENDPSLWTSRWFCLFVLIGAAVMIFVQAREAR